MSKISLDEGLCLGEIANQLAALEDLYAVSVSGGMGARNAAGANKDWETEPTPEFLAASDAEFLFQDVNRRTHDLTNTLQDLILQMEPRTLDETLSLALVYKNQMTMYLNDIFESPESVKEDEKCDRQALLERAVDAIIRGLKYAGPASSPLKTYLCEEGLTPLDRLYAKASEAAALYCDRVKSGRARRHQRRAEEKAAE